MPRRTNNRQALLNYIARLAGRQIDRQYPATVGECLSDRKTFRPDALRAVRRFRRSKPFRGTIAERKAKYRKLNRELAAAYGIPVPTLRFRGVESDTDSGSSCYCRLDHSITLRGRLSVITFLHEFGHARGYGERGACRFSLNLFRRFFPRAFARLRQVGHTLVRNRPE